MVHTASGVLFPELLGKFKRGESTRYDRSGNDISWAYTRFHLVDRLNATLYVYPFQERIEASNLETPSKTERLNLLKEAFAQVKEDIVAYEPNAELVFQDHSIIRFQGEERHALMANYIFQSRVGFFNIQFFTSAYLIGLDRWLVLIRLTAPDDSVGRSMDEIVGFLHAFIAINDGSLFPQGYGD